MKKHVRMQADSDVDRMVAGAGITEAAMSAEQEVMQQVGRDGTVEETACVSRTGAEKCFI